MGDRRGEESFVKSAKLSLRKDEVLGVIDKLKYQDKQALKRAGDNRTF